MADPIPLRLQRIRAKGARLVSPNGLPVVYCGRPSRWGNHWLVGCWRGQWVYYLPGDTRFEAINRVHAAQCAVARFRDDLQRGMVSFNSRMSEVFMFSEDEVRLRLIGKNLSCWCRLCERHRLGKPLGLHCPDCAPCHVDVIGEVLYG